MAVRREKVLLELEDRFSNPMLRAAAAAKTMDRSLSDIDRNTVSVDRSLSRSAVQSQRLGREIDRTSGRLRLFVDAAVLLGPALVPISAVAVPAITALASQAGAAALGMGTMVVAFQGVGDALTAVNDAALEPSAENLEKARQAMASLSPAARDLVRQVQEMRPAFTALRDAAAAGLFPGLSSALDDMERVFPDLERILFRVGDAAGDLGAELGDALAGPRGQEFLNFIAAEMPDALTTLGRTVGNFAAGMGELWQAFTPLNRDVTGWLLDASRAFDDWAQGLSQTRGFQEFVAYIREAGPQVADAMGAIGNAVLQIVQAAAPLGGPTLAALEAVADVIGAIAGSSYGPALIALAGGITAVSRASKALSAIKASSLFQGLAGGVDGSARSLTKMEGAGIAAGIGLSAAFAAGTKLVDLFREDLPGVEQLTGMLMDLRSGDIESLPSEFNSLADSIERITNPSFFKGQQTSDTVLGAFGLEGRTLANATDEVEALEAALMNMLQVQGPQATESAFRVMAEDAGLTADQITKLRNLMPGYTDALAGAERAARQMGDGASAAGRRAAQGFERAASAAQRFRAAIAAANRVLEGRAGMRDYEQAIDDLSKSVRQNGRTLDTNTQKGRDNQAALDDIASAALTVAENMRKGNREPFLRQARKDMIDAGEKLGLTREKAAALADRLLGLDKMKAEPKVDVNTAGAQAAVQSVEQWLNSIQDEDVYVDVHRRTFGGGAGPQREDPNITGSDGITVPGSRYPYRDKVLAYLAPGEEVISNRFGQADRHRELLKAINANRYASGGTVGGPNISVGSPNVNVGGAQVTVLLDGRVIDARVESRLADHATDAAERRTSYGYGSVG